MLDLVYERPSLVPYRYHVQVTDANPLIFPRIRDHGIQLRKINMLIFPNKNRTR